MQAARSLPDHLRDVVRTARELEAPAAGAATDRALPVREDLRGLLPGRGLRRGSVAAVAAGTGHAAGGTSLLLALLAEPSRTGSWCAVVGMPELGIAAAAEYGVVLERLALVPAPGARWQQVVATLLDGFDLVAVANASPTAAERQQLAARCRQRGSVLIPVGPTPWTDSDLVLTPLSARWYGIRKGSGRLRCRAVTVGVRGRGAAMRPKQAEVWLPDDPEYRTRTQLDENTHRTALRLVK